MKLKKKEFADLKQGSMIVNEYLNSFIQLSIYAPDEINTDEKKHDMFLNGLNDDIQFQLLTMTTETSSTWLTRSWLLKTRSRRWRRMSR
jgi:SET domain-containing protein